MEERQRKGPEVGPCVRGLRAAGSPTRLPWSEGSGRGDPQECHSGMASQKSKEKQTHTHTHTGICSIIPQDQKFPGHLDGHPHGDR